MRRNCLLATGKQLCRRRCSDQDRHTAVAELRNDIADYLGLMIETV
jgi:hypothetical protein